MSEFNDETHHCDGGRLLSLSSTAYAWQGQVGKWNLTQSNTIDFVSTPRGAVDQALMMDRTYELFDRPCRVGPTSPVR